jgi:hypothetical protein
VVERVTQFNAAEIVGDRYVDTKGEWLLLYEHPVTERLVGVREAELDELREDFSDFLRRRLERATEGSESRERKLRMLADELYRLEARKPVEHQWLALPADTRPGRNRSTIADHSLLVSGFSSAIVRGLLLRGRAASQIVTLVGGGLGGPALTDSELVDLTRIACLCHDLGKHPPQRHNVRGAEQVARIFAGLLDRVLVEELCNVARRHHSARSYRERGETPLGLWETGIGHADSLASGVDRPLGRPVSAGAWTGIHEFLASQFGTAAALSLISADTDRVRGYVFESPRLPEVRGGSAILRDLNEEGITALLRKQFLLPPECVLYAAGGSALIVAPADLAPEVARAIDRLYVEETGSATVTVVHHSFLPEQWARGVLPTDDGFGGLVAWLGYRLRLAKESKSLGPHHPIPPFVRPCDSCGVRPAAQSHPEADARPIFLCQPCSKKRRHGQRQKPYYLQDHLRFLRDGVQGSRAGRKLAGVAVEPEPAPTLHEIGESSKGKASGYVGVIYADGNSVGDQLSKGRTAADFRTLSAELLQTTRRAVYTALGDWPLIEQVRCEDGQYRTLHLSEILAIGGDDVYLIVPGDVALDIALGICQRFGASFADKLSMSAGVLIMPSDFPIYHAERIVRELLASAKRAGMSVPRPSHQAMVDFQVITGDSSLTEDLPDYRARTYRRSDLELLTERPYSASRLKAILELVRLLRRDRFPASQLYQLRGAVAAGGLVPSANWHRYQLGRSIAGKDKRYATFHDRLVAPEGLGLDPRCAPWRYSGEGYSTPICDLVEILEYARLDAGDDDEGRAGN